MDKPTYSSFVETLLPDVTSGALLALFTQEAIDHGFDLLDMDGGHYRIPTPVGLVDFFIAETPVRLRLCSTDPKTLYYLKESIDTDLADADMQAAWQGNLPITDRPPSFSHATVVSKAWLNEVFMRVRLTGPDIERFFVDCIHFRLIYPKNRGAEIVWPYINEQRRTIWPEGDLELMRPIYTIRQIDTEARCFDFDIFMHEGGPTAEWALAVEPGEEVGLLGPAGGWMPDNEDILLAGDETAVPAIARIAEQLPANATGHVLISLETENGKVPFTLPEGMSLQWLIREPGNHDLLFEHCKAVCSSFVEGRYIWFAANKSVAKKARNFYQKELGYSTDESYIAGYWH